MGPLWVPMEYFCCKSDLIQLSFIPIVHLKLRYRHQEFPDSRLVAFVASWKRPDFRSQPASLPTLKSYYFIIGLRRHAMSD